MQTKEDVIRQLATVVGDAPSCEDRLRGIIISTLSDRAAQVYAIVSEHGPATSGEVKARGGLCCSLQRVSNILLDLDRKGIVERQRMAGKRVVYKYSVVPARADHR